MFRCLDFVFVNGLLWGNEVNTNPMTYAKGTQLGPSTIKGSIFIQL